jgi:uncharacterized protein YxeA
MKPVKRSLAIFLGLLLIVIGSISTIKTILADDNFGYINVIVEVIE